jgi:hypothetical protein
MGFETRVTLSLVPDIKLPCDACTHYFAGNSLALNPGPSAILIRIIYFYEIFAAFGFAQ